MPANLSEEEKVWQIKNLYALLKAAGSQFKYVLDNDCFNNNHDLKKIAQDAKAKNNYFLKQIDVNLSPADREVEEEKTFKILEFLEKEYDG